MICDPAIAAIGEPRDPFEHGGRRLTTREQPKQRGSRGPAGGAAAIRPDQMPRPRTLLRGQIGQQGVGLGRSER